MRRRADISFVFDPHGGNYVPGHRSDRLVATGSEGHDGIPVHEASGGSLNEFGERVVANGSQYPGGFMTGGSFAANRVNAELNQYSAWLVETKHSTHAPQRCSLKIN